jgi:Phage tail assembly chaperone proteins, E, or 41 or 14
MHTVTLSEAFLLKGRQVTEIGVREPTAIEMFRAFKRLDGGQDMAANLMFARDIAMQQLGAASEQDVAQLDAGDMSEIAERAVALTEAAMDGFDPQAAPPEVEFESLTVEGIEYSSLTVRAPRTGEMLRASSHMRGVETMSTRVGYQMALVSEVSGVKLTVVHRLPMSVVARAAAIIEGFRSRGRRTGSN